MEDLALPLKNQVVNPLDPPLPLHVHVVGPVDHDLADLRVFEQALDRPEADDFIGYMVHHLSHNARREDHSSFLQDRHHLVPHPEASLGWAQSV